MCVHIYSWPFTGLYWEDPLTHGLFPITTTNVFVLPCDFVNGFSLDYLIVRRQYIKQTKYVN